MRYTLIIVLLIAIGLAGAAVPSDVLTAFSMVENKSPSMGVVGLSGTNPDVFSFPPFMSDKFVMKSSDRLGYYNYPNTFNLSTLSGISKEGWPIDTLVWLGYTAPIPESVVKE